ncbi:MAG TPA: hypothetical protein VK210_06230 [Terriglobia bacterium]|nr:hypothetical protein [Terriglobia bacterium]
MASRKLEEQIDRIRQLRNAPSAAASRPILEKSLRDRANLVVAEAAKVIGDVHVVELIPELLAAYARLFEDAVKTDPKCWGKTSIVKALTVLDYCESPPYVRGASHVQMEPVWGGQEDAAAQLRSNCILALPQCSDLRRNEVLRYLVDALADSLDPVRLDAVRAIEQMNGDESPLILRLKARLGDRRPAVTGRVFDALLGLEPKPGLVFVSGFLKSNDVEVRDEAALAMGSSRQAQAVQNLIAAWNETIDHDFRSILLRAISASREESALEFLLSLVKEGSPRHAGAALEALAIHSDSPEIQQRVIEAKNERAKE